LTEAKLIPALNKENLSHFSKTYVPSRLLLGPGPSNAHPEVLNALSLNPIGHLDEAYISLMSDVQQLLRYTWQCNNRLTLPMSGTGSAAMEASIANFIEEGEKILIAKKGYFGDRLVDMATRYKADVSVIEKPWGESFSYEEIKYEIETKKPAIFAIEISSAIPFFSRSESFNDLDPLRTTDPPFTWQPAQTFLKIVSPSLISEAIKYLFCKEV